MIADESAIVTIERVHEAGMRGVAAEFESLLSRIPAVRRLSDPCAIALRALKIAAQGDVPAGAVLLRRAIEISGGATRQYLIDLYLPLIISRLDYDEVDRVLALESSVAPPLEALFASARAQVAARRGDDNLSRAMAASAIEACEAVEDELLLGRVLSRISLAAYYREDFDEAQERALEAARLFERVSAHFFAARVYSILYMIAYDWSGNHDVARFYAQRVTMHARVAGDVATENYGVIYQLDIAAETGDVRRMASLRARLLANPLHEQYRERYPFLIASALSSGWSGDFDAARTALVSAKQLENRTLPERALCDALLAVVALGRWQLEEARRFARLALSETAHRGEHEPLFEVRRRTIARVIAAGVCVAIGDPSRGRRALSKLFDPERQFVDLLSTLGMPEDRVPPLMRGYVRFLNVACDVARRHQPKFELTNAELEILRALPDGLTVARLAAVLGKSPKTVEAQVSSIYAKLNVSNRAQAIQRARDLGLYA